MDNDRTERLLDLMTIYMDYLLMVNFAVDLLLLYGVAVFGRFSFKKIKLIFAAVLGAVFAAALYFMPVLPAVFLKFFSGAAIVWVAFQSKCLKNFFYQLALFFGVSCFLAGIIFALYFILGDNRHFQIRNGVYYLQVPIYIFLLAAAFSFLILWVVSHLYGKKKRVKEGSLEITIALAGREAVLYAFMDTGNHLSTPFTEIPVIVVQLQSIQKILPPELISALQKNNSMELQKCLHGTQKITWCFVPYEAIGRGGMLFSFLPDEILVNAGGKKHKTGRAYVAVSTEKISDDYDCLFHSEIELL